MVDKKENIINPENSKEDIEIVIDGEKITAKYREFKSKRKGYGAYGLIKIKGYPYRISINLIEVA